MTIDKEVTDMKNELLATLGRYGVLKMFEDYWLKRAECASRSLVKISDADLTNMVKGQISICYEIADETRLAREKHEASANADTSGAIPVTMGSVI
jgi:hypothetical protein